MGMEAPREIESKDSTEAYNTIEIIGDEIKPVNGSIDNKAFEESGIQIVKNEAAPEIDAEMNEIIDAHLADTEGEDGIEQNPEIRTLIDEIKSGQVIEEGNRSRAVIEHIMAKLGFLPDGIESNLMAQLDESSNFNERPHQDIKTIISKHDYDSTKEVKLVHMSPLTQQDLEKEGLTEIGIELNKEMYMVFVRDKGAVAKDTDPELGYAQDQSDKIAA